MLNSIENILIRVKWVQEGIRDFGDGLKFNNKEMENFQKRGVIVGRTGTRLGIAFKKMFLGLHGFRMEMLSVMFFGMGMQRFFMGLVRPSMDMVGVFEIFSVALGILFLPFALQVLDWALRFLSWVQNMSPEMKKTINEFVKWGIIIGTLLFSFGSLVLGIGGLITAFAPLIATILMLVTNPLALLLAGILGITAVLVGKNALVSALSLVGDIGNSVFQSILNKFPGLRKAIEDMGIHTQSLGEAWDDIYAKWIKPAIDNIKTKLAEWWADFKVQHPDIVAKLTLWKDAFDKIASAVITVIDWVDKLIGKIAKKKAPINLEWGGFGLEGTPPDVAAAQRQSAAEKAAWESGFLEWAKWSFTHGGLARQGEFASGGSQFAGGAIVNISISAVDKQGIINETTEKVRTELERVLR